MRKIIKHISDFIFNSFFKTRRSLAWLGIILLGLYIAFYFSAGGRLETILGGDYFNTSKKYYRSISDPQFSNDNSKIIFTHCEGPDKNKIRCHLAIYEIPLDKLHQFSPTDNQYHREPAYSYDSKKITFIAGSDNYRNVYVMNRDGSGLRQLTHNYNKDLKKDGQNKIMQWNAVPSFSPDGKRIIFIRSSIKRQRSMGGEMFSNWDVYEIDIETGLERRLTNYAFYQMSKPYYMPDGKRVIFSASTLNYDDGRPKTLDAIYIMGAGQYALTPAFTHGWYSTEPSVSSKGDILFLSETSKMDEIQGRYYYDLFIKAGDTIKRLTNRQFDLIHSPSISLDGSHVVFLASETKSEGPSIWVMNSDGSELMKFEKLWNHFKK
jgi:Tol biopolymer transport system component